MNYIVFDFNKKFLLYYFVLKMKYSPITLSVCLIFKEIKYAYWLFKISLPNFLFLDPILQTTQKIKNLIMNYLLAGSPNRDEEIWGTKKKADQNEETKQEVCKICLDKGGDKQGEIQ